MAVSGTGFNQTASSQTGSRQTGIVRVGTRGSPLALIQAEMVSRALLSAHPELACEIVPIKTTGDKVQDRTLNEIGGKGLFTKEIEEALLEGRIDLAVHSMKDMPTVLPDGMEIAALLEREDPRDAWVSPVAASIQALPEGAIVGTASLRRQAQVLALRRDLKVMPLRGNVGTRLAKLAQGEAAGTLLALAGLKRLRRMDAVTAILSPEEMLPAVAQGAIGIEIRTDNERARRLVEPLDHPATSIAVAAERACLAELDGSCRTPIAAYAELQGDTLWLRALIALPDGSAAHRAEDRGAATRESAVALGFAVGQRLKSLAGPGFLA
ncbi:MAG TPA: hydroxymethylbilane synthase [Dongiaceae bacterium]|jgi:hydroxymethylbilane synthase